MVSKGQDRFVLWPAYFDIALSRANGRRVPETSAVNGPDAAWIEVAARRLGLEPEIQDAARHPSIPYEKVGRVLVARKGPKQSVLHMVAAKMRESQDAR